MPTPRPTLSAVLRAAIRKSRLPYQTLERETGVTRASIMRFVTRRQSLRLDKAERLAAFLGLELTSTRKSE
jgi:hypothetical protein